MSDRRRNLFILLAVLGLLAASVAVIVSKPTQLGLDLRGGVQLVYQAKPTPQVPEITPDAMSRSLDIMRQRVDQFGVNEPEILQSGEDQLELNLAGVEDPQRVADQVGTTASMVFYDWEPNVLDEDCKTNETLINGGQDAIAGLYNAVKRASGCPEEVDRDNTARTPLFYAFDKESHRPLLNGLPEESREAAQTALGDQAANAEILEVPRGIVVVRDQPSTTSGSSTPTKPDRWWVIKDEPVLQGTDIRNPEQTFDEQNQPIVTMEFSDEGRETFADVTREIAVRGAENAAFNPGGLQNPTTSSHHFAIRLDQDLISTPYINFRENPDGIDGGSGASISGGFTIQSAQDLANLLKIGALPVTLDLVSRSQVSATLGQQALDQGLTAALAGFAVVAIFLIVFYRVLGVIAAIALVVYALYFYALIKLIPITLTLPGIAGLILTIGVAADANIVIFERVKEEVRAGRSISAGIAQGYKKGFSTIVDANVVTLLVAFILFVLATAGVKGFALTLGIGTIVSLFTAVLATQALLLSMRGTALLKSKSALGAGEQRARWTLDFMGASRWFFSMSGVILMVCALAIAGKGIDFGIDFESGTRFTASLERAATVADVREALPADLRDAKVQTIDNPDLGANVVQISTEQSGRTDAVTDALQDAFGLTEDPDVDEIGPTFGASVARSALIAIIASLLVISVYITLRFEWKFAVPVLIALTHDLLITAGIYALVDREVTTSTVAALLTILGFSLYDTIIVFDRIRENVPRMPNASFSQIVNRSMSEVLTRSLATSFCTLLPVLALYFFGGETLQDFAFALIVGTASGTYSSVFIAGPVLTHWKEREPVWRARHQRIKAALGSVPAYAVALAGQPVEVAPSPRRARSGRGGTVTASRDPREVSSEEFDDMVANLGLEEQRAAPSPAARPAGGRRARMKAGGDDPGPGGSTAGSPPPGAEGAGEPPRERRPRNRRHGRPR
jgi:SecD/SecF fusion protein